MNHVKQAALAAGLAGALLAPASVLAQPASFSERPVTIMVPFSAGGGLDTLARLMADRLTARWGQPVIVENRPGAGGMIASAELIRAEPDGHTVLVVAGGHALNELIYQDIQYDTLDDFTPVTQLTEAGNVVITHPASPLETIEDVIEAARNTPGGLSYGTAGVGTTVHLSGELFARQAGIEMEPIHHQGDAGSVTAVLGEHIPVSFNSAGGVLSQVRSGNLKAIAVTSPERMPSLPDVPTIAESGLPDYEMINWWGMVAPAGLPEEVLAELHAAVSEIMEDPALVETLAGMGLEVAVSTPEAFDALIRAEMEKWAPIIEDAGISL